ncbi:MAG TPA: S41 family peptidase [Euzebyales bacterium]|nr:S41 family peptidase [Euzebyales bacterium]
MRRSGLVPTVVGVVLAVVAGVGLYLLVTRGTAAGSGASAEAVADLDPVIELYEALNDSAVDAPDAEKLVDGAIQGMLDQVDDKYARYFPAEAFEDFNDSLDGTFSGVGLMLQEAEGEDAPEGPVIVSVLPETPAAKAGIEEGERIVAVDGEDVSDAPLEHIVAKVKGEPGTTVSLGLAGGDEGRRTLEITRAEFDLPLTTREMLQGDVGYVRLYQFADGAGVQVRLDVRKLVDDGADGIVLDLRNNPGGLLNEAVSVASVFIEDGDIVAVKKRGGERETYGAVDDAFDEVPLVVLVNENSASASEIVAGAVQDVDRGSIVGEATFGKGTVQTIAQLSDGSGAKFTTARYFTPSGDSIEGVGVKPDVKAAVDETEEPVEVEDDPQVDAALDELDQLLEVGG